MIREKLQSRYPSEEVDGLIRLIFEKVLGLTRLEMHMRQNETISEAKLTQIADIVNRLAKHEPIQYILGETEFYGLKYNVSPSVLIPRPETEELVDWILNDHQDSINRLLDIGTGSGCIPISIAINRKTEHAEGWDISTDALEVAKYNALKNSTKIQFSEFDILCWEKIPLIVKWDIIVSNPPYVMRKEHDLMLKNVTDFEPHLALFVEDNDPLLFYQKISDFAFNYLNNNGYLYFEINESLGKEVVALLQSTGLGDVVLRKDINGKDRMVRAQKQ